jgi:CBS domain containing-hemolysin-like protein
MKRHAILWILAAGLVFAATARAAGLSAAPADPSQLGQSQHFVMMVVYAVLALGFSFLCSVAEAVVLSVTPSFIANLEKRKTGAARRLKKVKVEIDRSLAAILTLNTIAHTVGAGGAGAEAAAYFGDKYVGIAMAVLTLLILFLSEIIPKTLGALYWRRLAPATARFIQLLIWVLFPLIYVSELLTKLLTRGKSVHSVSREEFGAQAEIVAEAGHLTPRESRILKNLLRFPDLCAEDVMTPSTVVFDLQQDLTVHEAVEQHKEISFTRIPIYGTDRDEVTGFVLKTDLLNDEHHNQGRSQLHELKRDLIAVPDKTPLSQVLEQLLDNQAHILLVVDNYGGMEGVVTLEDAVETLIGIEIVDEADKIDDMRRLARQKWEERMERIGIDVRDSE